MKKTFLFLLFIIIIIPLVYALDTIPNPWQAVSYPFYPTLRDLYFVSTTEGWVVGDMGYAYHTLDGGMHWSKSPTTAGGLFRSVVFTSSDTGYIAGQSFILKTINGGNTWYADGIGYDINHIYFRPQNAHIGYFLTSDGWVFRTQNSATTWTSMTKIPQNLNSIVFPQSSKGYMTSSFFTTGQGNWSMTQVIHTPGTYSATTVLPVYGGALFVTQNNSGDWSGTIGQNMLYDMQYLNSNTGWISAGQITTTHITSVTDAYNYTGATYTSSGHFDFSYDITYYLFRTTDGGNSLNYSSIFTETNVSEPRYLHISFPSQNTGYVAPGGKNIIYQTKNSGVSWSIISTGFPFVRINGIQFKTDSIGWLIGTDGVGGCEIGIILYTNDAGKHWTQQSPLNSFSNSVHLGGISFGTDGVGWLVGSGEQPVQYKSTDDGYTWYLTSAASAYPNQVITYNKNTVYLVGSSMMKTVDGGQNWNSITVPYNILQVQFINSSTIRGCGYYQYSDNFTSYPHGYNFIPAYIESFNQGSTWNTATTFSSTTNFEFYTLYFLNSSKGWLLPKYVQSPVTTAQWILQTKDGGKNWSQQTLPHSDQYLNIRSMAFNTLSTGWVCSGYGDIFNTIDGGSTWSFWGQPVSSSLNKIYFLNSNVGWIIGDSGVILQTQNGGLNWFQLKSNTSASLYNITFSSKGTGYIVGDYGTILRLYPNAVGATSVSKREWELLK